MEYYNHLKKVLFVCCTHGDEYSGKIIYDSLPFGYNDFYHWKSIIANPEAMYINTRYIDKDLNRSFPGVVNSDIYEEARAYKISKILKGYDHVIDVHCAFTDMPDHLIIVNKDSRNLAKRLSRFDFVLDFSYSDDSRNSGEDNPYDGLLIQNLESALAIEYGNIGNYSELKERVLQDVNSFLENNSKPREDQIFLKFFKVLVSLPNPEIKLTNFSLIDKKYYEALGLNENQAYYSINIGEYEEKFCDIMMLV